MARYIDADKLCEALKSMASVQPPLKQSTILGVVSTVENYPTADVVPKSEVEELQSEIEELQAKVAKLRKENIELLVSKETDIYISMEKLVKVRTEHPIFKAIEEKVAREIFEEIENNAFVYGVNFVISKETLADLKKKYTEGSKQ